MLDGVYDVHCDELPIGEVRRAGLVLPGVLPPARSVVFDTGSGRFTRSAFLERAGRPTVVSVIDLVTGRRRRLWSGVGGWSAESAVGWSPGGDLVAATYLVPPEPADEDYMATVVVRVTGEVVGHFDYLFLAPPGNGAWLDAPRLVAVPERRDDMNPIVVDVRDGREFTAETGTERAVGR